MEVSELKLIWKPYHLNEKLHLLILGTVCGYCAMRDMNSVHASKQWLGLFHVPKLSPETTTTSF